MEAGQAGLLRSAAASFRSVLVQHSNAAELRKRHQIDQEGDKIAELAIVQKILAMRNKKKYKINPLVSRTDTESANEADTKNDNELVEDENSINFSPLASRAYKLAKTHVGRWDAKVAQAIMEALGIPDSASRIKETIQDLRVIRKVASGLRETLERCKNALEMLNQVLLPNLSELFDGLKDTTTSVCAIYMFIFIRIRKQILI